MPHTVVGVAATFCAKPPLFLLPAVASGFPPATLRTRHPSMAATAAATPSSATEVGFELPANSFSPVALSLPSCADAAKPPPTLSLYYRRRRSRLLAAPGAPSSSLYAMQSSLSTDILSLCVCLREGYREE